MADIFYEAVSGFYDAIDQDRVYTADQMNMPYKRLVSNGVFASPDGTPSTDLQVVAAGGMTLTVNSGNGLFGDKWFELPADITIEIPGNASLLRRIDSVIVQVDKRLSGRKSAVVYRTGVPAADPSEPEINTIDNVIEFRLASVSVGAGESQITASMITDKRGSSECPWVTSLIYQVDTSTIFEQFQAAYADFYEGAERDFDDYISAQRTAWEDFLSSLTDELSVVPNVMMLQSTYVTAGEAAQIPIGVSAYDPDTDILQVFVNGVFSQSGAQYEEESGGQNVRFYASLVAGTVVSFVVYKSIVTGSISSAVSMMQKLDSKVSAFTSDTGWQEMALYGGAAASMAGQEPRVRMIGNRVTIRGEVTGVLSVGGLIAVVPAACRPAVGYTYASMATIGGSVAASLSVQISADGYITILSSSAELSGVEVISLATDYIANSGYIQESVYSYKGSVASVAALPASGNSAGDIWTVTQTGSDYIWDGAEWMPFDNVITSAQIADIIASIH